jgi:ABC-2 type transport system permease protein
MGPALRSVADVLPLTLVTRSVREPWLGIGSADASLLLVSVLAAGAAVLAVRRTAL